MNPHAANYPKACTKNMLLLKPLQIYNTYLKYTNNSTIIFSFFKKFSNSNYYIPDYMNIDIMLI